MCRGHRCLAARGRCLAARGRDATGAAAGATVGVVAAATDGCAGDSPPGASPPLSARTAATITTATAANPSATGRPTGSWCTHIAPLARPAPAEEAALTTERFPREGAIMRSTPLRRAAAASVVVAALGASVAPASAAVSLAPIRPCLSELDAISPNAAGLTPGGPVKFDLMSNGRLLLSTSSQPAAPDGTYRVAKPYPSSVTDKWFPDDTTETIPLQMAVSDLPRANAGLPLTSPDVVGSTQVTFSRFGILVATGGGAPILPGPRIRFRAVGWTTVVGRPLCLLFVLGRRIVRSVRLGVLAGPCGSLTKTLPRAFPFRPVRPGQYRLLFCTSLTKPGRAPAIISRLLRVRQRDAIPAR